MTPDQIADRQYEEHKLKERQATVAERLAVDRENREFIHDAMRREQGPREEPPYDRKPVELNRFER